MDEAQEDAEGEMEDAMPDDENVGLANDMNTG